MTEQELFDQHSTQVRTLARLLIQKLPANIALDDLIQAGMIGLHQAFLRFDAANGAQFSTYAKNRVRGAMADELRATDHLSISTRRWKRETLRAICALEQKLLRQPTESEISAAVGLDLAAYRVFVLASSVQIFSLQDDSDDDDDDDDGKWLSNQVAGSPEMDPLAILIHKERITHLVKAIDAMPERLSFVLHSYYENDLDLKQIASMLRVSEPRISQLLKRAVEKLRRELKKDSLLLENT